MVDVVGSSSQNAYVNPFQQRVDSQSKPAEQKAQDNNTQPAGAESAGSQRSETNNQNNNQLAAASNNNQSSQSNASGQERGSNLDITV